MCFVFFFFFFQAEDGIRDWSVTGVQTCALPICDIRRKIERCVALDLAANVTDDAAKPRAQKLQFPPRAFELVGRSEERRVGKECRSRWSTYHYNKNRQ